VIAEHGFVPREFFRYLAELFAEHGHPERHVILHQGL
jgi:hypothetical protein